MSINDIRLPKIGTDPRLGRRIDHDPMSAFYRYPTEGLEVVDVEHACHIDTLNQGAAGKCTAEAACYDLASDPFWSTLDTSEQQMLGDIWTDGFYSDEESLDGDGPYPPNDNGSSGLTSAKIAKSRGLIAGYQHTFTGTDALKALGQTPISIGMLWKEGCDDVNVDTGEIKYTGAVRGGHEISGFKIDAARKRLWTRQSWGQWGYQLGGTMWMSFGMLDDVLGDQGDVTIFVPKSQPAPTPTPPSDVNAALVAAAAAWEKNILSEFTKAGRLKKALDAWKAANGLA